MALNQVFPLLQIGLQSNNSFSDSIESFVVASLGGLGWFGFVGSIPSGERADWAVGFAMWTDGSLSFFFAPVFVSRQAVAAGAAVWTGRITINEKRQLFKTLLEWTIIINER